MYTSMLLQELEFINPAQQDEFVPGSPLNALNVSPPFSEYHFIDINQARVGALQQVAQQRANVFVHDGDCNQVLLKEVFPKVLVRGLSSWAMFA